MCVGWAGSMTLSQYMCPVLSCLYFRGQYPTSRYQPSQEWINCYKDGDAGVSGCTALLSRCDSNRSCKQGSNDVL